jgi:hypothetical protein
MQSSMLHAGFAVILPVRLKRQVRQDDTQWQLAHVGA